MPKTIEERLERAAESVQRTYNRWKEAKTPEQKDLGAQAYARALDKLLDLKRERLRQTVDAIEKTLNHP